MRESSGVLFTDVIRGCRLGDPRPSRSRWGGAITIRGLWGGKEAKLADEEGREASTLSAFARSTWLL